MSIINISDITVLENPAKFTDPYLFKITFECMAPLEQDLEWKLIYVGSADSESFDQELDTCMVGPVPVGINSFEFSASAPSPSAIPSSDLIGVTVILLTCSYNDQEFVRVGYYVNTEYEAGELKEAWDKAILVEGVEGEEAEREREKEEQREDEQEEEEDEEGGAEKEEGVKEDVDEDDDVEIEEGEGESKKEEEKEKKKSSAVVAVGVKGEDSSIKPPDPTLHVDRLVRCVLGEKPRVTRFNIKWDVQELQQAPSAIMSSTTNTINQSVFSPAVEPTVADVPPPFNPYA